MKRVVHAVLERSAWRHPASVFTVYLFVALFATWPLVLHLEDHACGFSQEGWTPSATPPLNIWSMAMVLHQLPRNPTALLEGTAFYPYHDTVAFSEHLLVPALLASPFFLLTGNWVLAYNLTLLLTLATAALGMNLLVREIIDDSIAAFAAGLLYAFHTWNINELVRSQITANQWFPFVVLALIRYFDRPTWKRAAMVGLVSGLQSLSCMYWALYLPILIGGTSLFLMWRRRSSWRTLLPLAAGLLLPVVATGLLAIPYLETARELGFGRIEPPSVPLDRYLDVLPQNWIYVRLLGTALHNQNAAHFLGFLAMGLGVLGIVHRRHLPARAIGFTPLFVALALGGFFFSLGPEIVLGDHVLGPGPYRFLRSYVPGFRNVRYPERLSVFLVLGLAPLVAMGLARLRTRLGRPGLLALTGLLFLEHVSIPRELMPMPAGKSVPQVYRWLKTRDDVRVVAEIPASGFFMEREDAMPMYLSTIHWKRMAQGYTSYFPPTYNFMKWRLFHFPAPESVAFLERFGVDTVIVNPRKGMLPTWAKEDPRWERIGPFPEGQIALRLSASVGPDYPPPPADEAAYVVVDRQEWQVEASTAGAERAIDGDPSTAWATKGPQRSDDFFRIRFPQIVEASRVVLTIRVPSIQSYDFPMRLEVLLKPEGGAWETLPFDEAAVYDRLFSSLLHRPKEAAMVIDFQPRRLRALKLRIRETDPFWMPWTLPEIQVYVRR